MRSVTVNRLWYRFSSMVRSMSSFRLSRTTSSTRALKDVMASFDLKSLRKNLLELHRLLLAAAKKEAEATAGRTFSASDWFQVLIADPKFKWLGTMTTLLTDLDALADHVNIASRDLSILRHAL